MDNINIVSLSLGSIFGLLLTLFIQPLIEDKVQGLLIRMVACLPIRSKQSLAGKWASIMLRDEEVLSRDREIREIQLYVVRNSVAGTFTWMNRKYRFLGKRHTDNYLTGTYEDELAGGNTFHGAFQLKIYPNEEVMVGRWVGFNSDNEIIEGPWEWRRDSYQYYSFEINNQEL